MEFKKHLNEMYGYNKEELSFRKLDFGVGIRRESWKNNVVAVGLSSFFLEPIESTAISTMHHQISTVYNMLMHDYILPKDKIKRFNEINNLAVDAIASYIELHYTMTKRTDSQFWKDVASIELTDEQKNTLDLYLNPNKRFDRSTLKATTNGHSMFDQSSYLFLYLGYDLLPNNTYAMDDHETL
jgi:tryptophan halogenase